MSLSSLVAAATLTGMFWWVAQPRIVAEVSASVSDEFAEAVDKKVEEKTKPINTAFIALLSRDVSELRRQISRLEFQRDDPTESWTIDDSDRLLDLQLELESTQSALDELTESSEGED